MPVPLEDVPGGGEQDILDAAQRQLDIILHDASINPGLIESLGRELHARVGLNGHLVLGGLLAGQVERALAAVQPAHVVARIVIDDWFTVVARRPSTA